MTDVRSTARLTCAGGQPPYQQDPPGLPRPDVVRGRVVFYDSHEADSGRVRAGIIVDLLRRTPYHEIEIVASARTIELGGPTPEFRFEIERPGEYAVRVRPDQPALEGHCPPASRELVSFTCGVLMEVEFGVLPRL
jgi:hypothetical protein